MKRKLIIALAVPLALVVAAAAYRHFALVQPLKVKVLAQLNDPDSAQFRNMRLFSTWRPSDSLLCGEINARNRMGGYVGYRHFIAWGGSGDVDIDDASPIAGPTDKYKTCDFAGDFPWWGAPF